MNPLRDPMDEMLFRDAALPLPDGGFTARVLAALPSAAPHRAWWKPALILGSTALGGLLAIAFAPGGFSGMLAGFGDLAGARLGTPAALGALASAAALALSGAILAAETD